VDSKAKRRLIVLGAASALATAGTVALAVRASGELWGWAVAAATSPLAMKCLAVMVAGVVALGVVLALLVKVRPSARPVRVRALHGDQGGTAAIEMALVFPFGLMIFLMVTQAAILFNANMVVHYATFCAARVATVVVPLDLATEEGRNLVLNPALSPGSSEKLEMIRRAAVVALMPISASLKSTAGGVGDSGGTAIQNESSSAFKRLGAEDKRPWFYMLSTKPSYSPWFKRAKAQYDYANGEITAQGGKVLVTQVELMKPEHWRTPPSPHRWDHNRIDGGFTEGDWDPQNVSNLHEDCPYPGGYTEWRDMGGYYDRFHVPRCNFQLDRMDYHYHEDLNVRVTYQFLLEVPYANRFLGEEAQVAGRDGKEFATEIRVIVSLSNEGGPEVRPKDYNR